MSKNYDSGLSSLHATPNGFPNQRAIEYSTTSGQYIYVFIDMAGDLFYNYGNANSWTSEQLTGVGQRLNLNVDVSNASLVIDQNGNHVHIAFLTTLDLIYHCECIVPLAPNNNANWTTWGGNRYQRVDNTNNTKGTCSIAIDGNTGNGTNSPHVVWDEDIGGTYNIFYNYGNGANHAFTVASAISIANAGETSPTIVVIEPDGRDIYAFWVTTAPGISCKRCLNGAVPLVVGSWGGPIAGAGGGPDAVLTGTTYMTGPSASWWWDMTERVGVTSTDGSNVVKTRMWDQSLATPAWTAEFTAAGYTGTATTSYLTRVQSASWRLMVNNTATNLYHAHKTTVDFSSGATWYKNATTNLMANSFSCDWCGLEFNDGGNATHRTAGVWQDALSNLWFSQVRENHTPAPTQNSPVEGAYIDELVNNDIEWGIGDADSDGQREYSLEIDDDIAFGSPLVQTGWTTTASTIYLLTASTAAANTTYYWRIKCRDDQYGTEYDPYSESAWYPTSGNWSFKTTPQITINIIFVSQQADKDCYITIRLASEVDETLDIVTHEYNSGGGLTSMTVIDGESTCAHNTIPVTGGVDLYYELAWNSDTDLGATFDGNVDVKIAAQYKGNTHGLGPVDDTKVNNPLDFAVPSQAIGVPNGTTITSYTPTLYATVSDTTGYYVQFEIADNVGFSPTHQTSGYLAEGTSNWLVTTPLSQPGTWYFRAMSKDSTVSQNENGSWVSGTFTFSPPPDPTLCFSGTWLVEIDPTKMWTGDEFDVLDDIVSDVRLTYQLNAPHTLQFTLNNYQGRYMDPSSEYCIKKGDEVRMTRGNHNFFGTVKSIDSRLGASRTILVYCESWSGAADAYPIQGRVMPTATSSLYAEDYIKGIMTMCGFVPKWFMFVNSSGDEFFSEQTVEKSAILSSDDIVYDRITLAEMLNDLSARTGKVWYEGSTAPTGRKAYLYWVDAANTTEGATSQTFYLESDVLGAALSFDDDSLVNRVVFRDADVVEQDMDSIRTYGLHTKMLNAESATDKVRLIEIAQYILSQRSTPRMYGDVPLVGEVELSLNELVAIYEESASDVKSGFSGNYAVAGITYEIGNVTTTTLSLTSRWEDPIIKQIQEMLKAQNTTSSDTSLVLLRVETAEVRVECPTNGVSLTTEASDTKARLDIDRYSDEDTDADYYSTYGGP